MLNISQRTAQILANVAWVIFFVLLGLTFYVNHHMPHGPLFSTGDYDCQNDGRGPCGESFIEETRNLDIPEWAKFLRRYDVLVFLTLGIGGLYLSAFAKGKTQSFNDS